MSIKTVSYAKSDIGRIRSSNQDSGYSGYQLHFVADGMGGHAGGDIASAMVTQNVARHDRVYLDIDDARKQLVEAMLAANRALADTVTKHSELAGLGTTFSGMVMVDDQVAVAHIGDSRVYLMREGKVRQVTNDHTFVQRLVELGKITEEEALVHPRRSVLMRVLGDVDANPEIDTEVLQTKPGDRWLMCSDGLCGVVPDGVIRNILTSPINAEEAADLLVGEALEYGAPDNVTVVLVDVISSSVASDFVPSAHFVGSAANEIVFDDRPGHKLLRLFNPRSIQELLGYNEDPAAFAPESDEYLEYILNQTRARVRTHRYRQILIWVIVLSFGVGVLLAGYNYTQTRFYVGISQGHVAIFKGIKESLGPLKFGELYRVTQVEVADLSTFEVEALKRTIPANNFAEAANVVQRLIRVGD